jgi:hypothetical protein
VRYFYGFQLGQIFIPECFGHKVLREPIPRREDRGEKMDKGTDGQKKGRILDMPMGYKTIEAVPKLEQPLYASMAASEELIAAAAPFCP